MLKKIIINFLRIFLSFGLVAYLIYIADIPQILKLLSNIDSLGILLAALTFGISLLLLSWRWYMLTRSYGLKTNRRNLLIYYLIGLFFNNFLPTSIGGDLARAYYLARESGNRSASLGTVFLERVVGLMATLTLAFFSLFWLTKYFSTNRIIYYTMIIIVFLVLFLASVMSRRIYRRFNGIISLITFYDLGDKIVKVLDTLHYYRDKKLVLLGTYIYSLAAQFVLIIMNYILAMALGLHQVTFSYLVLVVPITFVIGLLPSINGIGVRDTGYLLLLSRQGLDPAQVLSLSFSVTILPIAISLLGGIYFLVFRHKGIKAPDLKEERIT